MVNNMNQRKAINKITFNLSAISNILLGGVVLTGNYRFEPQIIKKYETVCNEVNNYNLESDEKLNKNCMKRHKEEVSYNGKKKCSNYSTRRSW